MTTFLWHAFLAVCVGWTLGSAGITLLLLVLGKRTRRPIPPRPPVKPFQGRLPLPNVNPHPVSKRNEYLRSWIDEQEMLANAEIGEPLDNIIPFHPLDRSRHDADMARRLNEIKVGKRMY